MSRAVSPPLATALQRVRSRLRAISVARGTAAAAAAAVALLAVWMWVDLVLDLSPIARVAADVTAVLLALALFTLTLTRAMAAAKDVHVARRLDLAANTRGQILSGVDLMRAPIQAHDPTTAALAQLATERAAVLAAGVSPALAAPARVVRRAFFTLGTLLLCLGLIGLIAPRLASTQWSRFLDPFGDHPPYSRLNLSVEPGDARVLYGKPLEIRVTADGPLEKAELVLASASGAEESLPMFPEAGGRWQTTVARVTAPARYYVRSPGARTRKFSIDVITVPTLQAVRFRITPPAYTHRAPYEGPMPPGGVAGLPGTKVELWAKSNRPLQSGELKLASSTATTQPAATPSEISLAPTTPNADEVTGSFNISAAGKYDLRVTDQAGQLSTDSASIPITVLADSRPFVRILEPKPNSFATPDATLQVQVLAEDDYGVSRVQLFRSLNASRARPMEIAVPPSQPTRVAANLPLKLDDYGLSPGDSVELYARVEDNDPAGAKGSESSVVTIKIISKEELNRLLVAREGMEVLQSKYEQANRRLEAADNRIKEIEKQLGEGKRELTDDEKKELAKLANELEDAAAEVDKTSTEDLPFDLDKALRKELAQTADSLKSAAGEARQTAKRPGLSASAAKQSLEDMRERLGTRRNELADAANAPLEHLAKIFPLIEDQARFIDLYEKQKDLAQRMDSLRTEKADDPQTKVRMRDLEAEQRQLREELSSLMEDVQNHVQQLPDDKRLDPLRESAKAFADAVKSSGAAEQMASAESFLGEFKGSPAQSDAQAAADTLFGFIAQCKGMGDQAGVCLKFQPKLAGAIGDTVEQLLEAEGFGKNKGQGSGSGGGFSQRRSTLRNVGLYGTLPRRGRIAGQQKGGSADKGASAFDQGANPDADRNGAGSDAARARPSGEGDAAVPPRYRRQVGDYFQRVSDELGDK